ncbi:PucR family transcriptional regulator [Streptomyces monticola]|uniref:PucR family transcriptional regulator n=1 Tax=Streptomyces monticola TaxID=2666263 RepID=A0ABW2JAJ6_9ACTN
MHHAIRGSDPADQLGPIPKELATIMWSELPSLLEEIRSEIIHSVPEYADALRGPLGHVARTGIEQSLAIFVDQITRPTAPSPLRDEMFRHFGRFAASEGRSLDTLQAAFRIGARVALRRGKKMGRRYNLSPAVMLAFADTLFAYMDQLEALSRQGYLEASAAAVDDRDKHRRRLLRMILSGSTAPRGTLEELAEQAAWRLPDEVTLVALDTAADPPRSALDPDTLVDLAPGRRCLLLPGELGDGRREMLEGALGTARAAAGLTVPLSDAGDSLRWARQALDLAELGVIDTGPLVLCEEHLTTMWLLSDPALLEQLARHELAPLSGQTPVRRERLIETLRAWLATRGTAAQIGAELQVHPQTVRYRMRTIDAAFGAQLTDPEHRFATEIVLRAMRLREAAGLPPLPQEPRSAE